MDENKDLSNQLVAVTVENWQHGVNLVERLFDVTQPTAVYGEPVSADGHTLITASEIAIAMGIGYGGGVGMESEAGGSGGGGGGGGGGASTGRPVAVISVGPNGVEVEPILDLTKIALALFTTLGSMFFMLSRMRRDVKMAGLARKS